MAGNYHKQNFIINNNNNKKNPQILTHWLQKYLFPYTLEDLSVFPVVLLEVSPDLVFCCTVDLSVGKNLSCSAVPS